MKATDWAMPFTIRPFTCPLIGIGRLGEVLDLLILCCASPPFIMLRPPPAIWFFLSSIWFDRGSLLQVFVLNFPGSCALAQGVLRILIDAFQMRWWWGIYNTSPYEIAPHTARICSDCHCCLDREWTLDPFNYLTQLN